MKMKEAIRQLITNRSGATLFETNGYDRGLTEVTSQVFLLILAIGLIGGLAVTLGGVTDGILPGPEGNVEMQQNGERLAVTIDTLDENANNVTITTTDTFNPQAGTQDDTATDVEMVAFDDPSPGQTVIVNGLSEDDVVNVVAHEDGSEKTNRIATMTVGPTGS